MRPERSKPPFKGRWKSATEAVAPIRNGMRVFVGSGCAAPQGLIKALTERDLFDVEILHLLTFGDAPYAVERFLDCFRHNAFFIGANVRDAVNAGRADYTPISLSEVPGLFRSKKVHLDAALIQVAPPDAHGFCSLGVSVDIVKTAIEHADYVVAEVNPRMPRTLGEGFVHVRDLHALVKTDAPILEYRAPEISPVAAQIASHVATLVEDGSTIQTGIGDIPSAVLAALGDKKDLGMHSELFTEAILPLVQSGVLNCRRKTLLHGKIVASFCFGTRRLYDFIHDNPFFEFRRTDFVNDPFVIARNSRMVAISSAIEVDLTGQVCSDSIGTEFYSGFGGQLDFVRGATRSEGGKAIIALPSTTSDGKTSRISVFLHPGAGVVLTRADVQYVVTEFGVAELHGKTIRERALALINIAHPDFREALLEGARERHLVHPAQIPLPKGLRPYPSHYESELRIRRGPVVRFRPIKPTDEELLKELFYSHSEETILQRYFTVIRHLSHEQLQRFVTLDYANDMALVGLIPHQGGERIICVGRYFKNPSSLSAEVAITVHDDFQGRGLGTFLAKALVRIALDNGIKSFTADVMQNNRAMLAVFHSVARKIESELEDGIYHLRFELGEP